MANPMAGLSVRAAQNGHQVLLLGPESGMTSYYGAEIVGTVGIPFLPYPELKLNLWRPKFTERLSSFDPHVIHLVDPVWLGGMALWILKMYFQHVPVVSSYHTNLAVYCQHFGYGWLTPAMWKWNHFCHRQCLYTACPSPSTRRMLEQQGFENVRLWPRGVDMTLFSPLHRSDQLRHQWMMASTCQQDDDGHAHAGDVIGYGVGCTDHNDGSPSTNDLGDTDHALQDKCVLLYVGRISFEKNINLLLDAYKDMDHSRCHLVLVGHGPAFEDIQQRYCATTVPARDPSSEDISHDDKSVILPITFTGYLRGMDLAMAYASADVFAFPSTTETFGQVVLEAMASGLPVAGLQAEGVCDLVRHDDTGLLLPCGDEVPYDKLVAGYKDILTRLVDDRLERKKMGERGALASTSYTWSEAMDCMVQVYRDAIRDKHYVNSALSLKLSAVDGNGCGAAVGDKG
ncbi:UDP-Glycosyltransferase/glycogen phosphorylase [Hesseltinella vesiculosa]|uniref:UDP-Glycosyltransferase/glycogen phosphorylase n=1 Tax=Hesseltinella vesiculosa TaxID=101127 RepID=A0A1X2GTL2_9FUNG|nr:UDP-Glycosyltransferase/glycogen phosphorylase [Hesseltinella vesiculosa]